MNVVRKHLSAVKGGGLALRLPGRVLTAGGFGRRRQRPFDDWVRPAVADTDDLRGRASRFWSDGAA
jgi:hypothetical protein